MATVSGGKPAATIADRPNAFLGATKAEVYAFSISDASSRVQTGIALHFGTNTEDGKPAIFILVQPGEMSERVQIAGPQVRDGIRKLMRELDVNGSVEVPSELSLDPLGDDDAASEELDKALAGTAPKKAAAGKSQKKSAPRAKAS